ncbi:MAG: T9SS type A sorting domain-containing protein, partial [Ginsengibacter sp.]
SSGYYIIAVNVSGGATDNNTIKINGATNPVVFGFTTSPNIINNQSDVAGTQTIQAADITVSTTPVATNSFVPGSNNNIVYIAQMSVATEPVSVNNIQFAFSGTQDANDLALVSIYFNATAATISGASLLNNTSGAFASGHSYSINFSNAMAIGSSGYYIIAVNVSPGATTGNTVQINGAANPVIFGFTTAPNIINNQTDNGGLHTLPVNFISVRAFEKQLSIGIEWKVASELNINKYIVERSGDGVAFNSIGETSAGGGSSNIITYNLLDQNPFEGNNFYRVSAVNKDGRLSYSPIVKISSGKGKEGISIYPNPVIKDGRLSLELQDLQKDTYIMTMHNQQGQLVMKQVIEHGGGISVQPVTLQKITSGIYTIEVRNQNTRFVKKLIVE